MNQVKPNELLAQFREMVRVLAEPAPAQERWLEDRHFPIDELYLQLIDAYETYVSILFTEGLLTDAVRPLIDRMLDAFSSMEGTGARVWGPGALRTSPEWDHIRDLAAATLAAIEPP